MIDLFTILFVIIAIIAFFVSFFLLIYIGIKSNEFLKYVSEDFFETKIHILKMFGKTFYNQTNNFNMFKWIFSDCDINDIALHQLKIKFRGLIKVFFISIGLFFFCMGIIYFVQSFK